MKVSTLAAFAAFTLSVAAGVAVAAGEESVVRGERLYDNWMREAAEPQPREAQPAASRRLIPGDARNVTAGTTKAIMPSSASKNAKTVIRQESLRY